MVQQGLNYILIGNGLIGPSNYIIFISIIVSDFRVLKMRRFYDEFAYDSTNFTLLGIISWIYSNLYMQFCVSCKTCN